MINIKNNKISGCLIVVFMLSAGGCKKGGNEATGSTTDTASVPAVKSVSFSPAGSPVNNSVYLEKKTGSDNEINLSVKIKGGKDVFGAAIELNYDGSKISYMSSSVENYLGTDSDVLFSAELNKGQDGILLVGIYRKGNVPGVSGDGTLFTITFRAIAEQAGTAIKFNTTNSTLKTLNSPSGNISGTSWFGGSLSYK